MKRFKHIPDGLIMINTSYEQNYEQFVLDCESLSLTVPVAKNEFLLFTPSRGVESIEGENIEFLGAHSPADLKPEEHPHMQAIVDRVDEFVALVEARKPKPVERTEAEKLAAAKKQEVMNKLPELLEKLAYDQKNGTTTLANEIDSIKDKHKPKDK